jgi:hypothetical protein
MLQTLSQREQHDRRVPPLLAHSCSMERRRVRRRVADEPADAQPERPHEDFDEFSALGTHLLVKWAWGNIPASEVQSTAKAALRDHLCNAKPSASQFPRPFAVLIGIFVFQLSIGHPLPRFPRNGAFVKNSNRSGTVPTSNYLRQAICDTVGRRTTCKDGASHPEIAELAALGSFGIWKSNVHGQLSKRYLSGCTAPVADCIRVAALDPKTLATCVSDCYIMAPHEWFGWLFGAFPADFDQLFLASPLQTFWQGVRRPT